MRVAIVNVYAHLTGGADLHCFGLATALRERGHDVRFLATYDERNVVDEGVFVPVTVTHGSRESLPPLQQAAVLANAFWNREAAAGMRRLLDEFRPDVVHAHKLYPQLSVAPIVVAARAGVPVVQTLHDYELISASAIDARGGRWDADETKLRFRLLNTATNPVRRRVHVSRVAAFVAVSRFVARVYARHGIEATVLPNFVVGGDALAEPVPFDEREGVVFVGRLRPEKGALDVVALARQAPAIPVTMVGTGSLEPSLRREAETVPNLQLAGFVPNEDLPRIVRRARVVVIPSRWQDPAPLVVLEAMANATPVVVYAVGGLAEYVSDAGAGRIVPMDTRALTEAAVELHDSRAEWELMSRRGRDAVLERHTPRVYAEWIEQVYEGVVRAGRETTAS